MGDFLAAISLLLLVGIILLGIKCNNSDIKRCNEIMDEIERDLKNSESKRV